MIGKTVAGLFLDTLSSENMRVKAIFKQIAAHPIKILASFVTAPILMIRIALQVKNPIRRVVAVAGLFLASLCAAGAGTFLGTFTGALFVASHVGWIAAFGFLFGTMMSAYMSFIFSILIFNAVSFLFLKMNNQDVLDYLDEMSS